MAESTLSLSAEQIEHWRKICLSHWATAPGTDGTYLSAWESTWQANALIDMAISAITLRATLAAEIERRERAEENEKALRERLASAESYREKYLQLSAQHVREIEARERALADAQECIDQKDASLLRGADAMTKDAEFIRSLKAELAKLRAPVGDVEAQLSPQLSQMFSIKVINTEHGNYWRCPFCSETEKVAGAGKHKSDCPAQMTADIARQFAAQVRERDGRIAVLELNDARYRGERALKYQALAMHARSFGPQMTWPTEIEFNTSYDAKLDQSIAKNKGDTT